MTREGEVHYRLKRLAVTALGHKGCWIASIESCIKPGEFEWSAGERKRPDVIGIGPVLIEPRIDRCVKVSETSPGEREIVTFAVEVKASASDLRNGYSVDEAHFNYLMIPENLLSKALDSLPAGVGLICAHGPFDGEGCSNRHWYSTERKPSFNENCWMPALDPEGDPWMLLLLRLGRKASWDSYIRDAERKADSGKRHAKGKVPWIDFVSRQQVPSAGCVVQS
jgi:hypothetical protein